jgi:5-formyltetrahydrofolate cyclo-ligase
VATPGSDPALQALADAKAALRRQMRDRRRRLPPDERARLAEAIEASLFALSEFEQRGTVLLFSSFGSEVPTDGIASRALSEGRRVLMPFLDREVMHAAELHPGDVPMPTSYGPNEPPTRLPIDPGHVDAIVVPGLAFDREGFRLGYGGGHYDRYLRAMPSHALRIGIAFHLQVVDAVPHGPGDEQVDVIVTEEETIRCRRPPPE